MMAPDGQRTPDLADGGSGNTRLPPPGSGSAAGLRDPLRSLSRLRESPLVPVKQPNPRQSFPCPLEQQNSRFPEGYAHSCPGAAAAPRSPQRTRSRPRPFPRGHHSPPRLHRARAVLNPPCWAEPSWTPAPAPAKPFPFPSLRRLLQAGDFRLPSGRCLRRCAERGPGTACPGGARGLSTRPSFHRTPFQSLVGAAGWGIPPPANSFYPQIHVPCGEDAGPRRAGRHSRLLGRAGEPGLGSFCLSTETAASSWPCETLEIGPTAPGKGRDCTRCAPGSRRILPGNRGSCVSKYH